MTRLLISAACLACAMAAWGCGGGDGAPASPAAAGAGSLAATPAGGGIPAGKGDFTVLLSWFYGPDHAQQAARFLANTRSHAGWRDLFVISGPNHSMLCWGRYVTQDAPAAQKNLQAAHAYVSPGRVEVYRTAIIAPLLGEEVGPPQWRLTAADGYYSVLVAIFQDDPQAGYTGRREHAVEYCRQLRQEGTQAWYFHGPVCSAVTVGSFPASALSSHRDENGVEIQRIADARVTAVIERFEYLAVNGRKQYILRPIDSRRQVRFDPSLVEGGADDARVVMHRVAQGYNIHDQRPYVVRVPGREPYDDVSGEAVPHSPARPAGHPESW